LVGQKQQTYKPQKSEHRSFYSFAKIEESRYLETV